MPDPTPVPVTPAPSDQKATNSNDSQATIKSLEDNINNLKAEISRKEMELLSPEYIEFRESRAKAKAPAQSAAKAADPAVAELQTRVDGLTDALTRSQQALQDVIAFNELQDVKSRYSDFETHRDDIASLLKNSKTELTYEQAYKIVKADKAAAAPIPKEQPKPFSSEKPSGSVPYKSLEKKDYKTETEANQATITALRDKWPDLGDTI